MNTGNLKSYAPQARKDFIAAVTARANLLGLSDNNGTLKVADAEVKNDIVMIAGRPWPVKVHEQRRKLIARIELTSFARTMEAAAYAWFNRLAALRFMELHDYLGHGRRVLSNSAGGLPEVLTHALDLAEAGALPGLLPAKVRELKLANQDAELYRQVLIAQCNALHTVMPFLFEPIGDETELLLPENLLLTDSVVAKLVQSIPEEDWQQIEIIGWLYQFYISEKKDQVIGKVVKSEDIPAATQLFTPNWIVKYMVQNSLGAQWLATYPDSPIKAQMEYYIEPAEQTDEVNAQLAAITPSSLDPEALTLMDPACGSGHILVEAYDLFKAIYLERGYRLRDVAQLILEKNLFGLDIDERAAQLTGLALMMKARADDRRLFERGVKLNVMVLRDSTGFDAERLAQGMKLADYGLKPGDLTDLKSLFEHATTFGSLLQVPEGLASSLPGLKRVSEVTSQDLFVADALNRLAPLVQQAELLASDYDAVVANPPYMGTGGMNSLLKNFAKDQFPDAKSDLFASSTERFSRFVKPAGFLGLMTPFTWMFLKSYEQLRHLILETQTLRSLIQPQYHTLFESAAVPVCTFVTQKCHIQRFSGVFIRLTEFRGAHLQPVKLLEAISDRACGWLYEARPDEFEAIPGSPVAYWATPAAIGAFAAFPRLYDVARPLQGLATTNDSLFLRQWHECAAESFARPQEVNILTRRSRKWFSFSKGGPFRKWYGNNSHAINYANDGKVICDYIDNTPNVKVKSNGRVINRGKYFNEGATWSSITIGTFSMRYLDEGHIFGHKGPMCFADPAEDIVGIVALGNSPIFDHFLQFLSPTLDYSQGPLGKLPVLDRLPHSAASTARRCIDLARADWNAYERSWDFQSFPLLKTSTDPTPTLESSYAAWIAQNRASIAEMKRLEEENNRLFIDAYGLADELSPDVPIEQITLTVNPAYRYGGNLTEEEQWGRFREDTMQELVSYAIGCMMGRYSLDEPGLIYANAGNVGFDASRYKSFPADADGIVPLTEDLWFEDDAALRVREFVQVAWGAEKLDENMVWLAEALGQKASESPDEAIRRYLADKFFKDHLQTYKKRPIYWLFSSGKQGAFQALVYLHRYNAGTLSRLRAEYVVPLAGKMQSRIELLEKDVAASSSTAARNRASKQLESLRKKHIELLAYDEKLRHYADQRIELDLDDGVKVNYGKFGDLLAEFKAVTGGKGDDE